MCAGLWRRWHCGACGTLPSNVAGRMFLLGDFSLNILLSVDVTHHSLPTTQLQLDHTRCAALSLMEAEISLRGEFLIP